MRNLWMALLIGVAASALAGEKPGLRLATVFGDHMVLQRDTPLEIHGQAPAKAAVAVELGGQAVMTRADSKGVWSVTIGPLSAGGPHELTVTAAGQTKTLTDILVGEVWFASGQSNMEWVLNSSKDPDRELKRADLPRLRFFTQKQVLGSKPVGEADGAWQVSSPETARNFSAIGYYFGKRLMADLKTPVGIVCAAWGGSSGESWMSEKALSDHEDLRPILTRWKDIPEKERKAYVDGSDVKLEFTDMKLIPKDESESARSIGDGEWNAWAKPGSTASFRWAGRGPGGGKVGVYQGRFQAAAWGGTGTPLNGGESDDLTPYEAVELRVKGRGVFKLELTQPSIRDYDYPCSQPITLKDSWQTVRARISDFKQAGWGAPRPFTPGEIVNIQFQAVMGGLPALPSAMFNGMVAPWTRYPMRGAIWYQGESNASRAEQYASLLKALIEDWRSAWKNPQFCFLAVQLPNFRPENADEKNAWAELREAQLAALELPDTAVVTTIDLGEPTNIHPARKEPVGDRLALAALRTAYGRAGALTPLFGGLRVTGSRVRVKFKNVEGGLRVRGGRLRGFEVAGEDGKYESAQARLEGSTVIVWSPKVKKPVTVRYAWGDDPEVSLFTRAGLPISPFRTDRAPGLTAGRR